MQPLNMPIDFLQTDPDTWRFPDDLSKQYFFKFYTGENKTRADPPRDTAGPLPPDALDPFTIFGGNYSRTVVTVSLQCGIIIIIVFYSSEHADAFYLLVGLYTITLRPIRVNKICWVYMYPFRVYSLHTIILR